MLTGSSFTQSGSNQAVRRCQHKSSMLLCIICFCACAITKIAQEMLELEAPQQGLCSYLFDDDRGGVQDASIPVAALDALHSQPAAHHIQRVGGAHAWRQRIISVEIACGLLSRHNHMYW